MAHSQIVINKDPQEVMREAMQLQHQHNQDDQQWLKGLNIPETIQTEILIRMIRRGGDWVDFTERLAGYEGDYSVLTEVSR